MAVFNLLPGSCRAGGVRVALFCHKFPFLGDGEAAARGDIGGVEVVGNENDEGPRAIGLIELISAELTAIDLGEGMAEPVEAYTGRSSSFL